jgi:magnesium transporter
VITAFLKGADGLSRVDDLDTAFVSRVTDALWLDLDTPTRDEELRVEAVLGIDVPTREEMQEIELSNRLYTESGARFMTFSLLSEADGEDVMISPMTLILQPSRLVTVRYASPRTLTAFTARCQREGNWTPEHLAMGVIEAAIERCADAVERLSGELDALSTSIFRAASKADPDAKPTASGTSARAAKVRRASPDRRQRDYQAVLQAIGRKGDILARVRDSLVSMQRLVAHYIGLSLSLPTPGEAESFSEQLKSMARDLEALREHAGFMSQKVSFLLEATLGLIDIEQSAIIKIVSVAAVIFLPPTLIASIYGMNFEFMPELGWAFGYPFAIGLMIVFAVLPYWVFKRMGWL